MMIKKGKGLLVILLINTCFLFSCGEKTDSVSDFLSSSVSSFSDEDPDYYLPAYEKADRSSSYIGDDNYRDYYHIFVPSFADSDGDGIGDLQGIIDKMDYLRDKSSAHKKGSLGINGILLSPIMRGYSYHKYDTIDYKAVDSSFGTLDTFSGLINEAHARGIKVILDIALNHASDCSKYFADAAYEIKSVTEDDYDPTTGLLNKSFIEGHPAVDHFRFIKDGNRFTDYSNRLYSLYRGWDYEGFASSMPDWNLDNKEVRDFQKDVLKFWLDKGADGFRLDAISSYYGEVNTSISRNTEYINYLNDYVKSVDSGAYIIAEGPWSRPGCLTYMKNTGINSFFDFYNSILDIDKRYINRIKYRSLDEDTVENYLMSEGYESKANPDHIDAYFNSNHDTGRVTNQFVTAEGYDYQGLKFQIGMQNLYKGNYFLYYGDEIGLMGTKQGVDDLPCRAPFTWSDSYTTKELEPGLSISHSQLFDDFNTQLNSSLSLFNFERRLMKIKEYNPEISRGDLEIVSRSAEGILVGKKTYNGSTKYLIINYSPKTITADLTTLGLSADRDIVNCIATNDEYASRSDLNLILPSLTITILK